jgi:hypothetical protein
MKKISIVFLLASMIFTVSAQQTFKVNPSLSALLKNQKAKGLATYQIIPNPISEQEMTEIATILSETGFSWQEKVSGDKRLSYLNKDKNQYLSYGEENGEYAYENGQIEPLHGDDTIYLKAVAKRYLQRLRPSDASEYVLSNLEYEYSATSNNPNQFNLDYLTFRFVRVIDGRKILDNTNHIRICLGSKGAIRQMIMTVPTLKKIGKLQQQLTYDATSQILSSRLDKRIKDGVFGSRKATSQVNGYIASLISVNGTLVPHISYISSDQVEGEQNSYSRIDVALDPSENSNLDDNDVIDVQQ